MILLVRENSVAKKFIVEKNYQNLTPFDQLE